MEEGLTCRLCRYPGSDVRLKGCGCTLHAKCVPLSLITTRSSGLVGSIKASKPDSVMCPCCRSAKVSGIYMFPMSMKDIDRAVQLRKVEAEAMAAKESLNSNGKRTRQLADDFAEVQAESSYLLMSHSQGSGSPGSGDADYLRTGRWTDEEIAMVDFFIDAFDKGQLPIPEGVRLNDFLRDMLLCKASRLTKKMKHAKLSTRCYSIKGETLGEGSVDRERMASLELDFLKSIASGPSRLELSFNIVRLWRSLLSNLCLQVGSSILIADDWIASVEQMERRASEAEETIRKARRRRMGLALKTDMRTAQEGVFFSGLPVRPPEKKLADASAFSAPQVVDNVSSAASVGSSADGAGELDFIANMLNLAPTNPTSHKRKESFDDFSIIFNDFSNPNEEQQAMNHVRSNCGPFLDAIISMVESSDLPFEHVDVWVPSFDPKTARTSNEQVRLYHGGYATRRDIGSVQFGQLNEYGAYSTRFSFAPGVGLPGRVYKTGMHSWERHIDEADPKFFERAGGAKVYGVKTGLGIDLTTNVIGRMVVALYSTQDLQENDGIVQLCKETLAKFSPEPMWKLVVEMAPTTEGAGENALSPTSFAAQNPQPVGLVHFQHGQSRSTSSSSSEVVQTAPDSSATVAAARTQSNGSLSSTANVSLSPSYDGRDGHDQDLRIASLLGDHIPLGDLQSDGKGISALVPYFMSLRLLLLRSPSRRSDEENERIDIIRKSFVGFSKDNRRTAEELAFLVVKDWQFLSDAMELDRKPPAKPDDSHKCHVLSVPTMSTYAPSGAPTRMPSLFPSSARRDSLGSPVTGDGREVSPTHEAVVPTSKVNIVADH